MTNFVYAGGGRDGKTSLRQVEFYFDATMFICFSLRACFFLSFFVCPGFFFLFSPFKGITLIWMEYCIILPVCLCLHLFVQRPSIVRSFLCLCVRDILKAIAAGLVCYHMTMNNDSATMKWFHA